jgi:hypothetical protein
MPTPNWGPQSGVPMDQATFDAYVSSNPPGAATNNIYGNMQVGANSAKDPYSTGGKDPYGQPIAPTQAANAGAKHWEGFFNNGPASVQMPTFQTGNQDQARLRQQQVIQDLQRAAAGDPNSKAQQQLSQSYRGAQAQQSSLGSTMRGQSAGAALRGVQTGQQDIQRGLAGDQQMLQVQEQQAAQQQLAQLLSQQQGQDITQATGMASGVNQGNSMNEAMRQFYAQQGLNAGLARENLNAQGNRASLGIDQQYGDLAMAGTQNAINAGAGLLGGIATMSNNDPNKPTKVP